MKRAQCRSGYTLIELVAVVAILGLLAVATMATFSSSSMHAKKNAIYCEQHIIAQDVEKFFDTNTVYSMPSTAPANYTAAEKAAINDYLATMSSQYLHYDFNSATLAYLSGGFQIATATARDSWGNPYLFIFNTNPTSSGCGAVMIVSGGPDGKLANSGYATGNVGDDIGVEIIPKSK